MTTNDDLRIPPGAAAHPSVTGGVERLMHATADHVFSEPQRRGVRVVIPAATVEAGFGFGFGAPRPAPSPGGRPVAVIEAGPRGVRVKPVLDLTRVGAALVVAAVGIWGATRR